MPKKEKPPARRAKRVLESASYATSQLVADYQCSRRTLRRWTEQRGYPQGRKNGKEVSYSKVEVHAWEAIHMPGLRKLPEAELSEEDKRWDLMRKRYLLEKAEREAGIEPPPPHKPVKVHRGRLMRSERI